MDDDFFSDDEFDTLNDVALQELENSAIQFTQGAPKPTVNNYGQPAPPRGQTKDHTHDAQHAQHAQHVQHIDLDGDASYAFDDDDALDDQDTIWDPQPQPQNQTAYPHAYRQPVPVEHLRPQPINPLGGPTQNRMPPPPPTLSRAAAPPVPSRYHASQAPRPSAGASRAEMEALQAQVLDLQSRLTTKDGETAIVRGRLEKLRLDHERELHALRKHAADEIARQERALELARATERNTTTELEFTRRDLQDELARAKRRDPADASAATATTPKRNAAAKSWIVPDGFENVEMAVSPSKGQRGRSAGGAVANVVVEPPARLTRTPTKGNKRKRQTVDSPVLPLDLHSDDTLPVEEEPMSKNVAHFTSPPPKTLPFDYLTIILNHSSARGQCLVFDYLAGFSLKSNPKRSLATALYEKLAAIGRPANPMRLPIEFCELVIGLWDACLKDKCLAPIKDLLSLVSITLQLNTAAVAPYIAPSLLLSAQSSCYEVGIPRFNNHHPGDPTDPAWALYATHIPTTQILSLLHLTALGCAAASPPITAGAAAAGTTPPLQDFWSQVHAHFVLMQISQRHPVRDFLLVLALLRTSVFESSIGPIVPDITPREVAVSLIERTSFHLVEVPRAWSLSAPELRHVRAAILRTLAAFSASPFGLAQLAAHDSLVPRLVSLLCACVDELYGGDMSMASAGGGAGTGNGDSLQDLVTGTMLLLHAVVTDPRTAGLIDLPARLGRSVGGVQKYRLGLARINFAEDLVSEETAELAHELLELAVTEEEGAELGAFFGG